MLEVQNLSTTFDSDRGLVHAVNDVSFVLERGEFVGIVGESGCGKSATIRSVLRMLPGSGTVTGGEVTLGDKVNLRDLSENDMRKIRGGTIGFIPQNPFAAMHPTLSLEKQFRNVMRGHGKVSRAQARATALNALRAVSIRDPERVLAGYPHQLSGGMAQRVVIALVLCLEPQIIIADEPTTALDVTVQRQILDLLKDLLSNTDKSVLLVTHDLGVVAQYCDRVIVMYAGKVVESGRVRDVFKRPSHPYTAALLGAVPRTGQTDVRILRGTVPSLIDYPSGCVFAARCDYVFAACAQAPPISEVAPGWHKACHLKGTLDDAAPTDR